MFNIFCSYDQAGLLLPIIFGSGVSTAATSDFPSVIYFSCYFAEIFHLIIWEYENMSHILRNLQSCWCWTLPKEKWEQTCSWLSVVAWILVQESSSVRKSNSWALTEKAKYYLRFDHLWIIQLQYKRWYSTWYCHSIIVIQIDKENSGCRSYESNVKSKPNCALVNIEIVYIIILSKLWFC